MTTRKNQNNGWTLLFIVSMVMGWGACTSGVDPTIEVTPKNSTLAVGDTLQFTAKNLEVPGLDLYQDITEGVVWTSSDPAVATVNNAGGTRGLVTAVSVGTTTIKAEFNIIFPGLDTFVLGFSNDVTVTVTAAAPPVLTSLAITPAAPCIVVGGATQPFIATGTFSSGPPQDLTTTVDWSSSPTSVATIGAATGVATAVAAGAATITATEGAISDTETLNVQTTATLVSIAVSPPAAGPPIAVGGTEQYTALGIFDCGPAQDLTATVTWASSAPDIATISNDPGTEGLATGVASGATTITATQGLISSDGGNILTVSDAP